MVKKKEKKKIAFKRKGIHIYSKEDPLFTHHLHFHFCFCFCFSSLSSAKMGFPANGSAETKPFKFLIYGRTGWIGGLLGKLCEAQKIEYVYGSGRLENRSTLEADIASINPTHVFNAAGVTGRPNVDWCETHKVETIRTNVVGTLTLADVCREKGLILINYATGCIFEYDANHTLGSGFGFKEEDTPNFIGSFYSKTKAMVDFLFLLCFNMVSINKFPRNLLVYFKAHLKVNVVLICLLF